MDGKKINTLGVLLTCLLLLSSIPSYAISEDLDFDLNYVNHDYLSMNNNQLLGFNRVKKSNEKIDVSRVHRAFKQEAVLPVDREFFAYSSNFGYRASSLARLDNPSQVKSIPFHYGSDLAAANILGSNVYSVLKGVVEKVQFSNVGYGNLIIVDHGDFKTYYAHLDSIGKNIKEGTRVERGEIIGQVGNTGRSTGPHLHFEIQVDDTVVNPEVFFPLIDENNENLKPKIKRQVADLKQEAQPPVKKDAGKKAEEVKFSTTIPVKDFIAQEESGETTINILPLEDIIVDDNFLDLKQLEYKGR